MPRFLLALAATFTATATSLAAPPNVLVILVDDLGYGDLGIHGLKECPTPHIDSLAKDGARFTSGYVTCPYCSPTRAALLTGRYQTRFGHEFNPATLKNGGKGQGMPVGEKTLADRLKAEGYRTAIVGKWHQGEEEKFHPLNRGFDEFFGFRTGAHSFFAGDDPNYGPIERGRERVELKGYLTDVLADEAAAFIDRNKAKPWFLYLAFNAVHTPMHAPEADVKKFEAERDPTRRTYLAMLKKLDDGVGRVLAKLKELKLEKDTIVFFLSDNGGPTTKFSPNGSRNGPLRGSKGDTWEGGIRVPFLVRWPAKIPAGTVYEAPVSSLDIAATALVAAGIEPKPEWKLDGVDLSWFLALREPRFTVLPHEYLYWRFGPQMAVRGGDWKLVKATQSADAHYADTPAKPMLFNLKDDPGEKTDLAAKFPDKVKELQAAWDKWDKENVAPLWPATLKGKPFEFNK
jgi:arylsulfatase A-like enzyme